MCFVGIIVSIWLLLLICLQFTWIQLSCHLLNQKKKSSKGSLKLEAVNDFNPKISFSDK